MWIVKGGRQGAGKNAVEDEEALKVMHQNVAAAMASAAASGASGLLRRRSTASPPQCLGLAMGGLLQEVWAGIQAQQRSIRCLFQ